MRGKWATWGTSVRSVSVDQQTGVIDRSSYMHAKYKPKQSKY